MVPMLFSRRSSLSVTGGLVLLSTLLLAIGCDRSESKETPESPQSEQSTSAGKGKEEAPEKPSAKKAREKVSALPPAERIAKIVNPKGNKPFAGKTGTVRGVVRASGDQPPTMERALGKMDSNCTTSRSTFGKLFREGPERELADALVAVTGYDGFVPAKGTDVEVKGEGCAWDQRTYALTFGQRLSIDGVDNRPYVPELLGQPMPAQLFVLPTAPAVHLPPQRPGKFTLVDSMRLFNVADVFVLPYATADVSNLDGEFEITGIPEGEVTINAFLPATEVVQEKKIVVKAGQVTEVDFVLAFDAAAYEKKEKPVPLDLLPGRDEK